MYLIDRNVALAALENIKNTVWGHDIPHPGNCPEYRELHEKMRDIMNVIDAWNKAINNGKFYYLTDDHEYIISSYQEDE